MPIDQPEPKENETPISETLQADPILSAEQFLRMVSKVVRDKTLYPPKHPQLTQSLRALEQSIQSLFPNQDKRTFAFIDDQVYVDDCLLTGLQKNPSDISRIFRDSNIELFTVKIGMTLREIHQLIEHLGSNKTTGTETPRIQTPHMDTGKVQLEGGPEKIIPATMKDLDFNISKSVLNAIKFSEESNRLQEIYMDWNSAQKILVSNVGKIMKGLEGALFSNFQSFLPFKELKSYDEYTHVHAMNLSILTMAQAQSLGFPKEAVHAFGIGALLHDVGKTKVSVKVLHKNGKLTPEEFEEMKRHPVEGALLLLQNPDIPRVAAIVAYEHHLKYNHGGYPFMRRERDPHIASKLTAIADQFDAMRSNRPYREAMPPEKIIEIMQENKGTDLDPELVDRFIALIKSRRIM